MCRNKRKSQTTSEGVYCKQTFSLCTGIYDGGVCERSRESFPAVLYCGIINRLYW